MEKLHFDSDYMRGACPEVLERLVATNLKQTPGYGSDIYCDNARRLIRETCGCPEAEVWFLVGGTQTNAFVIDAVLKSYQGVVCADTGHINVHEAGAIEATGHKVMTLPNHDGKIWAKELEELLVEFYSDDTHEHMVEPGMVYISYPTEYGTLYSLKELKALKRVCRKYKIPLYADGARLGYGLAAQSEVTLREMADIFDIFYIGGTKVGALFGEAVVIPDKKLIERPIPLIKQHGALLAKGRLLGIQFETLFSDDLYLRISRHAVAMAMQLKKGFTGKGYRPFIDSPTNQQFFKLPNQLIDRLEEIASFEYWGPKGPEESIIRFVTDWATSPQDIAQLIETLD